jgi:signal transduction histidine kinase
MRARTAAWAMVGLAVACTVAHGWLLSARGVPLLSALAVDDAFPVVPVAMVVCVCMGAVIVSRFPRHRIGWLLLLQVGVGVGLVAGQVAQLASTSGSPVGQYIAGWAALTSRVFGVPWALSCLALVFLLVPNGRLLSPRWRVVLWLVGAGYGLTLISLGLVGPVRIIQDAAVPEWLRTLFEIAQVGIMLLLLPALACLLLRARRATGVERRQLFWVLAGAGALALGTATYVGYIFLPGPAGTGLVWAELLFHAGYMAVPVCAGVAVLKYHLYDVDLVLSRAVRLAAMTALVIGGYVVAVTVIDTAAARLVPAQWRGVGTSLIAFVVVVLALQPLQRWLRVLADRVVYGSRAASYQALASVIRGLPGYRGPRDLLRQVADAAAAACNGTATARLLLPAGRDFSVTSPGDTAARAGTGSVASRAWPIVHAGQTVGRLEVVPGEGRLIKTQLDLLDSFAGQAGLAFHNAGLQAELAARAEAIEADTAALAESRRRLVQVAYAERDRLSATIQRDVMVHLRGLVDGMQGVRLLLPDRPDKAADRLERARADVNTALDELRTLTRGVYPAVLARRGLTAAIRSAISQTAGVAQLRTYGPVDQLPEHLAATAYFATIESLRDLTGPRQAALAVEGSQLGIEVIGGPRPEMSTRGVRDRVEAVGGSIESEEWDGRRRLLISLPLEAPIPARLGSDAGSS